MFSTTCWHLKSICVRAAAPLLMMSETENIWTRPMIVMARSTSTKLLPRRARPPDRRSRETRRSAILGHPDETQVRVPRSGDLLHHAHAPDRIDGDHVLRRRLEGAVDDVHVREGERGRRADLAAVRDIGDRAPLKVAHEDARVVPVGGVVGPECGLYLGHVLVGQAELLVDARQALHDDVVLVDEEVRAAGRPAAGVSEERTHGPVLVRVADQVEGHVAHRSRRDERADLNEGAHPAALPLRVRPLEENLDVPRGALELLALPGPRDLASADDDDDADDRDDRHQLDQAESPPAARTGRTQRWADEQSRMILLTLHRESPFLKSEVRARPHI